jgi:hypothetical protein
MSYTFRTLLIPPAQEPIATLICDELGYPEKGMFVATMREDGDPPDIGKPDTRAILGYISTGAIPDDSPLLQDAEGLYDEIVKRKPDTKVTLAQCTEFVNWLDLTDVDPTTRQDFMKAEIAGDPVAAPAAPKGMEGTIKGEKVADLKFDLGLEKESAEQLPADIPAGYPMGAVGAHLGVNWRNLVPDNEVPPAVGKASWRRLWNGTV